MSKIFPKERRDFIVRLETISQMNLGSLSDEEIQALVAERKELLALLAKGDEQALLEKKREEIIQEIETLNALITPKQEDDELLRLIAKRKKFEAELSEVNQALGEKETSLVSDKTEKEETPTPLSETQDDNTTPEQKSEEEVLETEREKSSQDVLLPEEKEGEGKEMVKGEDAAKPKEAEKPAEPLEVDIGREGITSDLFDEGPTMQRYTHELAAHHESLGNFLQNVSEEARKSKKFMLKVAAVDPAYAMHYASLTLKKDESFNVAVAGIKNTRNSGNALAEMRPEMRTGKVVLAGVKQDYRNVRFALPNMSEYDEILEIAKKGVLEKVYEMRNAADALLLVPKVLQKDRAFMSAVEKVAGSPKE